jgi:hypothetical protein
MCWSMTKMPLSVVPGARRSLDGSEYMSANLRNHLVNFTGTNPSAKDRALATAPTCVHVAFASEGAHGAVAATIGDVAKSFNPATVRKEAAKAERARPARNRLTQWLLIENRNGCILPAARRAMPRKRCAPCITPSLTRWTTPLRNGRGTVVLALDALTRPSDAKTRTLGTMAGLYWWQRRITREPPVRKSQDHAVSRAESDLSQKVRGR